MLYSVFLVICNVYLPLVCCSLVSKLTFDLLMTRKLAAILFPGQNAPVLRSKSLNLLENNRLISPQKLHALHKRVSSIETESISRTDIVQPILFLQMVNLFERFRSEQGAHVIKYAMGHSLGELA
jgi:malonyl CoA-acyl carrier protein transacylase